MAFEAAGEDPRELAALLGALGGAPVAEDAALPDEAVGRLGAMPRHQLLRTLETSLRGLTEAQADQRALAFGENAVPARVSAGRFRRVLTAARSPFVLLLSGLALVAGLTGSPVGAGVIAAMALASCALRAGQEQRGERAAAQAADGVSASVLRRAAAESTPVAREVPIEQLVPGDLVRLAPGDVVPADLYLLRAAELAVAEGALTGESRLVAKYAPPAVGPDPHDPERCWLCPAGGLVAHGTGTGVVIATGRSSALGAAQRAVSGPSQATAFDAVVGRVTRMLLALTAATLVLVLAFLTTAHGLHAQTLVFALAVAVGLTPEMLPVVTTGVLAGAARSLAARGIAVRSLPAVYSLGAMDTLCVDKTGTLTEGRPSVTGSFDPAGTADPGPLRWARVVSEALAERAEGLADAFDDALLATGDADDPEQGEFDVVDVLPFDPARRRTSVLLRENGRLGATLLVTRGAVPELLGACATFLHDGEPVPLTGPERARLTSLAERHERGQARLLAVAVRELPPRARSRPLRPADEQNLVLAGFVALRDRPRASAGPALSTLADLGVEVKVLTGDTPQVAAAVCAELGIDPGRVATGADLDACDEDRLAELVTGTRVFARVTPVHKARIVTALREAGRVTGFLGDGVNDAPALRAADVSLALRGGAELARQCADIVLGEGELAHLAPAVAAGRRSVANTIKYLKITISANAGNALSMLIAALLLPFLPMLPLQILIQNLSFDLAQLALATDRVETRAAAAPRALSLRELSLFTLAFAPINTLADLATFHALRAVLGPLSGTGVSGAGAQAAFHAGWFVENLLTQVCAIYLLRTGRLSWRPRASGPVIAACALLAVAAFAVPLGVLAGPLGFTAPPTAFYPQLAAIVLGFCALTAAAKAGYVRARATVP